jgi:amidase
VTFSGPAFSEPKLIGYAYALEQATKDTPGHHRVPSTKVPPLPSNPRHGHDDDDD